MIFEEIHDYSGLARALKISPDEVIQEVVRSGLRGRGGAGFATGDKWRACRDAAGDEKYVICNAHQGDAEAYAGRILMENAPQAVLEGMIIAAYAVGASRGYVYINADSTLAIERLRKAVVQIEEAGLLGEDILGSGFGFRIEVSEGAADIVCGEETAMIRSMEGRRAMPYPRPPYPAVSGPYGKPTCINNLVTLAGVAALFQGAGQGHETWLFTLGGSVMRPGVIEVSPGMTLRQVIFDIGGGLPEGKDFKLALVGGPAGGCLPEGSLDVPLDYEALSEAGAIIGSGGITVYDGDTCAVELARHCMSVVAAESCGECVLGREGTAQLLEVLTDITVGKGKAEDIDMLLDLGTGMKAGSLCALGRTAPNPVLTTIEHFRDEYELHIKKKQCPAKVCRKLAS
jgi:NADH-quinone oxidoreductase subunit F